MNSRGIILGLLALLGIPFLILVGQWAATDPVYAIAGALLLVVLVVIVSMGRDIWLLIPLAFPWQGALTILPGNFAPRDLVVGLVLPCLLASWVVKRFPMRLKFGLIEVAVIAQFVMVAQAYLRNPVGVAVLGSSDVGGRKYFEIGVSFVAFLILATQIVDWSRVRRAVWFAFSGGLSVGIFEAVVGAFPWLGYQSVRFYRGYSTTTSLRDFLAQGPGGGGSIDRGGRLIFLKYLSGPIMNMLLAFRSPLQLINPLKPVTFLLVLFAIGCVLFSGFRSGIVGMAFLVTAAALVRRRGHELMIGVAVGVPLLAVLLVAQGSLFSLPMPAQRALSFLPADWDYDAVKSAEGSLEWRVEMWEAALTTDRYIENKFLGDGFGFSAQELNYQLELQEKGFNPTNLQDYYLLTGNYHSGPVETIRRVGYLGLTVILVGFGIFFREAIRLIRRAEGTPYYPYALYVGLPFLTLPFFFILVFGEYKSAITQMCFAGGLLRLFKNSLEVWLATPQESAEEEEPHHLTTGTVPGSRAVS